MPKVVTKSSFAAALGDEGRRAFESHKDDETEFGNIGLPAGIKNGTAQLKQMEFRQIPAGKRDEGKWEFFARGGVLLPKFHNGTQVLGGNTFITEPMYETPTRSRKTVDEHLKFVLNMFRLFKVNTKEVTYEDMDGVAAALEQAQPTFSFDTFQMPKQDIKQAADGKWYLFEVDDKGNPQGTAKAGPYLSEAAGKTANQYAGRDPLVNHRWNGAVDYIDTGEAVESAIQDSTPQAAPTPAKAPLVAPAAKPTAPAVQKTFIKPAAAPLPQSQAEEALDLDALGAAAGVDGDAGKSARVTLTKLAVDNGVSAEVDSAPTWTDGVAIIKAAMAGAEAGTQVAAGVVEAPSAEANGQWSQSDVGSIYGYMLMNAKTKALENTQVEIMSFDEATQMVTLKNATTNKMVLGPNKRALPVSVNELVAAE